MLSVMKEQEKRYEDCLDSLLTPKKRLFVATECCE